MGIFGWSYPPGAANDPNAPYNQTDDGPCDVCGQSLDHCICPECSVCFGVGDPKCYWPTQDNHGLVRSFAQVALKAEAEHQWDLDNALEGYEPC